MVRRRRPAGEAPRGPKRTAGEKDGLTKTQAERALRKLIDMHVPIERAERMTVGQAGERYAESREALGRSPVTVEDYRSIVRVHFDPFFGATSIDRVTPLDVEGYVAEKRRDGRSPKSVSNDLALLAEVRRWGIVRKADDVKLIEGGHNVGHSEWPDRHVSGFVLLKLRRGP